MSLALALLRIRLSTHTLTRALPLPRPPHQRAVSNLTNIVGDESDFTTTHVSRVSSAGIELTDGLVLPGPCILHGGRVFLWDVPVASLSSPSEFATTPSGWKEMFAVFDVVVPKPELVILGTGSRIVNVGPGAMVALREMGVAVDVMDTRNACATYNLLLEEGRRVAAALIPPNAQPWR
ncbi:DUF498-domain-containing protein [Exidia glandulosa HHB12029]|uniref:DUF498-domain-containing protein n=1 Tax=Exidia glandulosa HHB12029 TaxID=1314781 RepID=A0A165MM80_EXIGL|nr:DUF498-domain-containing protein [Exidia glandulosa HHB12029]